jgi:two-component system, NarL family, nitrate/nitrite response regulator NarL
MLEEPAMLDAPHSQTLRPAGVPGKPGGLGVVVADDHPLFRAGIVRALEEDRRFRVVGEAADGPSAERLLRERLPDLGLLDLRMPGRDGLQVLQRLRHSAPSVSVIVLTAYTDTSLVRSAMAAGAAGFVAKDLDREVILEVLLAVAAGSRRVCVPGAAEAWRLLN